ncbi:hypothetical protein N7512_010605 [Penicillium capsulatum]|nr:hypothetical protein N7512_010605 [Penicillium capsulatum]
MYSILDEEWDLGDIANISLRKVGFEQDPHQWAAVKSFRLAWKILPPTPDSSDVEGVMRKHYSLSEEEQAQAPLNPDTTTVPHPLARPRDFKPPNSDAFGLDFPRASDSEDSDKVCVLTKVWESEVLLLPAYLAPGVLVRVETRETKEENGSVQEDIKARGKFTHDKPGQVWYLSKGLETRLYIECEGDVPGDGLAAVLVYGKMGEQQ